MGELDDKDKASGQNINRPKQKHKFALLDARCFFIS